MSSSSSSSDPSLVIVAGTYDGVLAGWQHDESSSSLELTFATPVHQGSIRSLCLASNTNNNNNNTPGTLLSCGYDEVLKTHDWSRHITGSGEVRTPPDFGTPTCSQFAPPLERSTHCLIGFSGGKLVVYKKRDWSIQHVLAGHVGGVASIAVHPSGKLALTGGQSDGKLKLWDLTRGRLAHVTKLTPSRVTKQGTTQYNAVDSLEFDSTGDFYAWCCGSHVTVKSTATGADLLDAGLPSRVNQVCLLEGADGIFLAAACNDGSLPVLAVQGVDNEKEQRRGLMAIEPVDDSTSAVAREERFKCILPIQGYRVVTANSAGVVSIMNLQGAVRMILSDDDEEESDTAASEDSEQDDSDTDEEELAVDIEESVRLGTGARITCLAVWCNADSEAPTEDIDETPTADETQQAEPPSSKEEKGTKRKAEIQEMDSLTVEKARALVKQAKKLKKRKERKKQKRAKG